MQIHNQSPNVRVQSLPSSQSELNVWQTGAFMYDTGIMTVNIFCDRDNHSHNLEAIEKSFSAVAWLPEVHDSNIVAIAFKQAPSIDFDQLYARAVCVERQLKLPAKSWVDGLMLWMQG